jgi:DsbC/DsbD-like thiol-disulfide interchange protein
MHIGFNWNCAMRTVSGLAAPHRKGSRAANCLGIVALLLSSTGVSPALSQTPDDPAQQSHERAHARVELIADNNASGQAPALRLGLHFELDPGWHIYWQNSGDSGQPPSVQWQLPPGFTAGAIEWPAPQRLEHPPIVDYGYENDVLLVVPPISESMKPVAANS